MRKHVRYDEEKAIYRDCKFCGGKGCLACPGEANKDYNREFPDGPQPIATFAIDPENPGKAFKDALAFALGEEKL